MTVWSCVAESQARSNLVASVRQTETIELREVGSRQAMSRPFRHAVYDKIIDLLGDKRWHDVHELADITPYPAHWLSLLKRDPRFDVDDSRSRLPLRAA